MSSTIPPTQLIIADGVADSNSEVWMKAVDITVGIFFSVTCCVGIFFMATIFPLRKFTFNLYVIFAIFPDCLNNAILAVYTFNEPLHGGFVPLFLCQWMFFSLSFIYFSNLYVNAVIAKEVMALVVSSYHARRTQAPSTTKVILQAGLIYLFSGLVSGWYVAPWSWSAMAIDNDPICSAVPKNNLIGIGSNLLIALPPFLYTFWVAFKIRKNKLLPLQGRTRALALYFWRIILVFVAFFLPIFVLANYVTTAAPEPGESATISYFVIAKIATMLYPIQTIVTFHYLLQKDDISKAVHEKSSRISTLLLSSVRNNTSRISTLLLSSLRNNNNEGSTQNVTLDAEPKSEWDQDDVYDSDTRASNSVEPADGATVVDLANVDKNEDIECSKD